jgi:integrase
MTKKRSHGLGTMRERDTGWLCEYRRQSKNFSKREFPTRRDAEKQFALWRQELDAKQQAGPVTTVGELLQRFVTLQFRENLAGASEVKRVVNKHLMPKVAHYDARTFGLAQADDYKDARKLERTYKGSLTRNATINMEMSYVTSALKLLRPEPRYLKIAKLPVKDGVRQGTVSRDEYYQLLQALENYQKPVWCFGYYTGVRRGELVKLRREWAAGWEHSGIIEVPGWYQGMRITKNGEKHCIPIYTESMREFLRWALETGDPACPYLFQRTGKPVNADTFSEGFRRVADRLGLEHILFHDLRRTAVTNMIEAGIPPDEAMSVSGHLDPGVFKRYNIIDAMKAKANVRRVGQRMAAWHAQQEEEKAKARPNYDQITTRVSEAKFADGHKPN